MSSSRKSRKPAQCCLGGVLSGIPRVHDLDSPHLHADSHGPGALPASFRNKLQCLQPSETGFAEAFGVPLPLLRPPKRGYSRHLQLHHVRGFSARTTLCRRPVFRPAIDPAGRPTGAPFQQRIWTFWRRMGCFPGARAVAQIPLCDGRKTSTRNDYWLNRSGKESLLVSEYTNCDAADEAVCLFQSAILLRTCHEQ